ncbi:uncharacterized protein METZ01_LOCUS150627 [marine metagenome]|uniref:Fe2OG dioxygenase domain-containing protein n=1 Tax=marine metagenome TaxID=408172 RepID=A0A382A9X7_9ZZZZ
MATDIIHSLVDLERYPVDDLSSDQGTALIACLQASLERVGSASLPGFLLPDALEAMAAEAESLAHLAYAGPTRVSPYFFNYDIAGSDVPDDHPTRFKGTRNVSQVAYDLIPRDSLLCRLYHSDVVTNLVARVRNKDRLYRLADRYQSLNISVMREGGHQQWHFDQGRLVTTLLMQAAEKGGVFEYVPDIRSEEEEHFDEVAKVLAGDRSKVRQLDLVPGSLNLFLGHYSMHRVTPVEGYRNRLQTIFAFTDEPDTQGNLKSSILHYGPRVAALEGAQA